MVALLAVGLLQHAHAAPGDPPPYADAFTRAFDPAFTITVDDSGKDAVPLLVPVAFRTLDLGKLIVSSGKISACDPFVFLDHTKPFLTAVPNGEHLVRLAIVSGSMSDGRIAFARVDFSPAPAVSWKMALVEGQDASMLKKGEIFGYGVDAGTGSFYDPEAGKAANRMLNNKPDGWEDWQRDGEANGKNADLKPNFFLMQPSGPGNIAMFASGWGDGFYPSWFGYDADGKVAALVTDFLVINLNDDNTGEGSSSPASPTPAPTSPSLP